MKKTVQSTNEAALGQPLRFFPIERGLYEVAPGLRPLSSYSGRESHALQFDSEFPKYRLNKQEALSERRDKYVRRERTTGRVTSAVTTFLAERAVAEYPSHFRMDSDGARGRILRCCLTGDAIELRTEPTDDEAFESFVHLGAQLQEDVAVIRSENDRDWIALLHLCAPNHWSAEEKIGRSFFETHAPVPGIERINRAASSFVDAMIDKGPFVRFVWGLASDDRLNHHPEPPPGRDPVQWHGRAFRERSSNEAPFYLRVERQITWGLPAERAAVFLIRTYFVDGREIRASAAESSALRSALASMTPESRVYKGVAGQMDSILAWLDG